MKTISNRAFGGLLTAIASGLLVAAAPVGATINSPEPANGNPAPAPAPTPVTTAKPSAQRYCVIENVTGSRIPQKTCQTKEEWAADGVDITKR